MNFFSVKIQSYTRKSYTKIPDVVKKTILEYYLDESNSYICPGQRDTVNSKDADGKRCTLQKRILHYTVHDLYINFTNEYKEKLDILPKFSYFASLRPIECTVAGDPGSHRICVCIHHENVKLRLLELRDNMKYQDIFEKSFCTLEDRNCMLHKCAKCPGLQKIKKIIRDYMPKNNETDVTFKFWEEDGSRASLITRITSIEDFIDELSQDIYDLTIHHFIAQEQNRYFKWCKNNIDMLTAIIIMDFSENYSFAIQDSVQAFYYNNLQATVHPFIIYYKVPGKTVDDPPILTHKSFCVISDSKDHYAYTIHAFQDELLTAMKKDLPQIKNVIYFSDGAPQQYKNK